MMRNGANGGGGGGFRPQEPPQQSYFKQHGFPQWWAAAGLGTPTPSGGMGDWVKGPGQGMGEMIRGYMDQMPDNVRKDMMGQFPTDPWFKLFNQQNQPPGPNTPGPTTGRPTGIGPGQEGPSNFRPISGPGGATALPDQRAALLQALLGRGVR